MKLVLCDDHRIFAESLALVLEGRGYVVAAVTETPQDALDAVMGNSPDICVLDLTFPGANGLDFVARIARASPGCRVVVLTGSSDPAVLAAAVDAGAAGFAVKAQAVDDIVVAIERAHAHEVAIAPALLLAALAQQMSYASRNESDARRLARFLTDREREVLERLVRGEDTGTLARGMGIARSTARTHIQSVLTKLGVHSRLEAAILAVRESIVDVKQGDRHHQP